MAKVTFNWVDHSGEATKTQVYVPDLLADGSNWEDITDAVDALQVAAIVATDCGHLNTTLSIELDNSGDPPPATVTAQREVAIRIKYRDSTTSETYTFTLPGPVTAFYPPTGVKGDYIPLDNAIFAAFILVLEANMVSPDGNAIEIIEGRLVGRNS